MVPSICAIQECDRPVRARGFCTRHYQQLKKIDDPRVAPLPPKPKYCTVDGCDRAVHGNGLCGAHWNRKARHGSVHGGGPDRQPLGDVCSELSCVNPPKARNLCSGHWKAWRAENDPTYREKRKAEWDRWYEENRERVAQNNVKYRAENQADIQERLADWKNNNTWHASLYTYTKRRRKYALPVLVVDYVEPDRIFERDGGECQICGDPLDRTLPFPDPMSLTIDHVMPVSEALCEHSYANTQLTHWDCNRKKRDTLVQTVVPRELRALAAE